MKPIVRPRSSGSIATYMQSIMEDMTPDQLAVIENDVLFDRLQVTGDNVQHRLHDGDQLATYNHLLQKRNRFAPVVAGVENWVTGRAIPEDNLIWQDFKYVITMRLLSPFFSINKDISLDLVVKFNLEQDTKKLFEAIVADGGENVNRSPPRMIPILFETPKIHYNTYKFTLRQAAIHDLVMGRIKGKRTGI